MPLSVQLAKLRSCFSGGFATQGDLMLVDPQTEEPTRIRLRRLEDGSRIRIAVKSGEQIPEPNG